VRRGLVNPQPDKRPKASYIRFAAELPNECWQADFTHWRLADGTDTEILSFIDDHSRYAISVTAHQPVTGQAVVEAFRHAVARYGPPASTLTDNGMVFTTRLSGGKGGRNGFETALRDLGIIQKNSRPGHPTTCGKVERFQQTLKRWLRAQPDQPTTLAALQALLDVGRAYARTPHHPARGRPRHPHHQHRHRRAPPPTHPRPHPQLPAHRPTTRTTTPKTTTARPPMRVRAVRDLLRDHTEPGRGIEPLTGALQVRCSAN
jgi:integrase-like protein